MAHNPYRKFKSYCIFCSTLLTRNNTTAEHLFGKQIQKIHPVKINSESDYQTGKKLKGSSPITHIKTRSVCKSCNNGWMSDEISLAYPILKTLIKGKSKRISVTSANILRRYFLRFAVLVDIESSNHDLSEDTLTEKYTQKYGPSNNSSPVLTQNERVSYKNGGDIQRVFIYIGHHKGILGLNPWMNHSPSGSFKNSTFILEQKTLSLVIGELAVILSIGRVFIKYDLLAEKSPFILLENSSTPWPPRLKVDYIDVYQTLSDSDSLKKQLISDLNIPIQERKRIEAIQRQQYRKSLQ